MSQIENHIKDIKNKKLHPIYFLMGDEPYFIDKIVEAIENEILTEEEKGFNQTIIYGSDADMSAILGMAKQYPMGAERSVVIVKEAQHLSRTIEQLESYAAQPQLTTILAFAYKGKTLDKRKKLYKTLSKNALVLEFKKLYENQIPDWIERKAKEMSLSVENKSKFLLAEFIGNDLSRIENELEKLKIAAKGQIITPEIVEENIGISKDYNNFELRKALETKDLKKSLQIAKYFSENPKNNPLVVTLGTVFQLFSNIIVYHALENKSSSNVASELGIHPFFVKDIELAAKNYPLKKATRIISLLRETDVKSKGIGSSGNVSDGELLTELIYKVLHF